MSDGEAPAPHDRERRRLLKACCCAALAVPALAGAQDEEAAAAPQADDLVVYAFGARAGQPIAVADLAAGDKQVLAYPMSAATQRVRDGSRLNQLIVVRLEPERLAPQTLARAAEGVVAYSGVCTHTGCDVTDWQSEALRFKCPCHESEFDPADGARVVGGPAPWQLAALPLKVVDGALAVAAPFEGRVGFAQPGFETFGA